MSIAAMLVESYALESAWSLAAAALYAVRAPISPLFFYCDVEIKVSSSNSEMMSSSDNDIYPV